MTVPSRLFSIVGPSGAGKDTLIEGVLALCPDFRRVRRVITRPAALGGEDFEPVSEAEFARRENSGDFALSWQAHGLQYGIEWQQLTGPGTILFNGSRTILPEAVRKLPALQIILVTAPEHVLAERLSARGRESAADILSRLKRGSFAMPEGLDFTTVCNDGTAEEGIARLSAALQPVSA
jgi:phosphonate metabolism protein PhnN/1,5-bisphosphokinase (PRPP-forming)